MSDKNQRPSYAQVILGFNIIHLDEYKIISNDLGKWHIIIVKTGRTFMEPSIKYGSGIEIIKSLIYGFYFKIGN